MDQTASRQESGSGLQTFGRTAKSLSRSPLGIIALFIVLVYGIAALVLGLGRELSSWDRSALVCFFVGFPVVVLGCFGWLVACHHRKLYGPSDFDSGADFLTFAVPKAMASLPEAEPQEPVPLAEAAFPEVPPSGFAPAAQGPPATAQELHAMRQQIYTSQRRLFLVHTLSPSQQPGQKYDVFLYIVDNRHGTISQIRSVSFFLGRFWGNAIFPAEKRDHTWGIKTSAYGPFLAVCEVCFLDGSKTTLQRYVDFEMGDMMQKTILAARR